MRCCAVSLQDIKRDYKPVTFTVDSVEVISREVSHFASLPVDNLPVVFLVHIMQCGSCRSVTSSVNLQDQSFIGALVLGIAGPDTAIQSEIQGSC